jgi:hypothetical protein
MVIGRSPCNPNFVYEIMSQAAGAESASARRAGAQSAAALGRSWRERLADPAEAKRILAELRKEKLFLRADNTDRDRMADRDREDTPLELVDHSSCDRLFKLQRKHFPRQCAEPLGYFLKRWKRSDWMRKQRGYREKAALAASSRGNFDGQRFCNCRPGRLCQQVHHCPRCKLEFEIRPALEEYAEAFEKAPFWFAAVPSISFRPDTAGLRYVTRKDAEGRAKAYRHSRPFVGRRTLRGITLDSAEKDVVDKLLRVPFEFAKRLRDRGLVDGAFVTREIALDFVPRPEPVPNHELRVAEVVLPHGNGLFNTRRKPGWRFAVECWDILVTLWIEWELFKHGYPDLLVGRAMVDQKEIKRWISYELKPMPFEKFYQNGIENGCFLEHYNLHFDQTVFRGIKMAFSGVKSPRKYGNMNCDPRLHAHEAPPHRRYLGKKPINRMVQRILGKLRKCLRQQPPGDLTEKLTESEMHFLAEHDLDGHGVTVADLERWDGER